MKSILTAVFFPAIILFASTTVALDCTSPLVPVNAVCKKVECMNPSECSVIKDYCTSRGQRVICRAIGSCECAGAPHPQIGTTPSCNKALNGNSKCAQGEVCLQSGDCIKDPKCSFFGDVCSLPTRKCCTGTLAGDSELFCHKRLGSSAATCVRSAFPGENCSGGIPCDGESVCLSGKLLCSKEPNQSCDNAEDMCPPGTACIDVPLSEGVNKECLRI